MKSETVTKTKRATMRGMGRVFQRGNVWWLDYHHAGQKIRETSRSTKRADAIALLKRRHEELGKGLVTQDAQRITLADFKVLIQADYALAKRRSGKRLLASWAQLAAHFGENEKVTAISPPRLSAYLQARTEEGAAASTIRTELAALKRAFNLAKKRGMPLGNVPSFPTITVSNARQGFFEREEHEAVRRNLPQDEGDVAEFLFWSGWRRGEAFNLRWVDVREEEKVIRIEGTKTKNSAARTLPFGSLPALVDLIEKRRTITDEVQKARRMVVSHVFHRNGEPIKFFRRSWISACIAAGLGKTTKDEKGKVLKHEAFRIPHDYRRSAARNLSRAGVPERIIMAVCGWKTRSVFDRYNIVDENDISEGLAKLAGNPPVAGPRKVATFPAKAS